jgi:hypothetical protein
MIFSQGNSVPPKLAQKLVKEGRDKNISVRFSRHLLHSTAAVQQQNLHEQEFSDGSRSISETDSDEEDQRDTTKEGAANEFEQEECVEEREDPKVTSTTDILERAVCIGFPRSYLKELRKVVRNEVDRFRKADFRSMEIISMPSYSLIFEAMLNNTSLPSLDLKVAFHRKVFIPKLCSAVNHVIDAGLSIRPCRWRENVCHEVFLPATHKDCSTDHLDRCG